MDIAFTLPFYLLVCPGEVIWHTNKCILATIIKANNLKKIKIKNRLGNTQTSKEMPF